MRLNFRLTPASVPATASRNAELASLHSQLSSAHREIVSLDSENASLRHLVNDYERGMQLVLEKLRPFAFQQAQTLTATRAHYNALLEAERQTNLELRLEHQAWQAGLARVANYTRMAFLEHSQSLLPYIRKIAGLKSENKALRRIVGWEDPPDSSDDEEYVDDSSPSSGSGPRETKP